MQAPTCPFICSDSLLPIVAHCMQKGSSRQIKSSLRSRSCRVWCDLHHFSSTGRDNRHMDSPHTLPPIYVYTRRLYMFTTILFHRYIFTRTLEHIPTNICVHQNTLPPIYVQLFIVHQNALPPIYECTKPDYTSTKICSKIHLNPD